MSPLKTFLEANGTSFYKTGLGLAISAAFSVVLLKAILPLIKKYIRNRKISKAIGEYKEHWLWGDAKKYNFSTLRGLQNCVERCKDFPAMCAFWLGPFYMQVHLYHPDVVQTVLSKSLPKGPMYAFTKPLVREGLVTSPLEVWRRHRRLLTPVFHFELLKSHLNTFNKNCRELLEQFQNCSDARQVMDVCPTVSTFTFANMMECVMSQSIDGNRRNYVIIQSIKDASFLMFKRMANPLLWSDVTYSFSSEGKKFDKCCKDVHEQCRQIILERRSLLESLRENKQNAEFVHIKDETIGKTFSFHKLRGKSVDFLDILLQTKDQDNVGLSDDEILDEVITFFIAGQETLANGISVILFQLACNPEHQQKCRNEITRILGTQEHAEIENMNQLHYLTQCIKESLRLMPVVHLLSRELTEDTTFSHRFDEYKEFTVNSGSEVNINIYALHRNPYVWENPNVFNPENFSPERSAKRSPYAFIPFAAGPRNCIGQHFAMHQIRVVLCQILRRFDIFRDEDTPEPIYNPAMTLQAQNGVLLKMKRI